MRMSRKRQDKEQGDTIFIYGMGAPFIIKSNIKIDYICDLKWLIPLEARYRHTGTKKETNEREEKS